jgi:predicted dehydrogenase
MTKVRWGFLSTASIARKNWKAISLAENAELVAVASRDVSKAQSFIDQCNAQVPMPNKVDAVGSYEELLSRSDIDAVYIPLPTGLRKPWVISALEAGKHVLSEKPIAINYADAKAINDEARKRNLQFMDGVMFAHSARYEALLKLVLADCGIGTVRRVATQFSFLAPPDFQTSNIRSQPTYEPLGCLGDLGWYCIRIILGMKNWVAPSAVIGRTLNAYGSNTSKHVPSEFSGNIFFDDGTSASMFCSFMVENQQWVHISGDKGHIHVDDFVLPYHGSQTLFYSNKPEFVTDGCDFQMRNNCKKTILEEYSQGHQTAQEVCMFRNFSYNVLQKTVDWRWLDRALATQRTISLLKESSDAGGVLKPYWEQQ